MGFRRNLARGAQAVRCNEGTAVQRQNSRANLMQHEQHPPKRGCRRIPSRCTPTPRKRNPHAMPRIPPNGSPTACFKVAAGGVRARQGKTRPRHGKNGVDTANHAQYTHAPEVQGSSVFRSPCNPRSATRRLVQPWFDAQMDGCAQSVPLLFSTHHPSGERQWFRESRHH